MLNEDNVSLHFRAAISHNWHKNSNLFLPVRAVKAFISGLQSILSGYTVNIADQKTRYLLISCKDTWFSSEIHKIISLRQKDIKVVDNKNILPLMTDVSNEKKTQTRQHKESMEKERPSSPDISLSKPSESPYSTDDTITTDEHKQENNDSCNNRIETSVTESEQTKLLSDLHLVNNHQDASPNLEDNDTQPENNYTQLNYTTNLQYNDKVNQTSFNDRDDQKNSDEAVNGFSNPVVTDHESLETEEENFSFDNTKGHLEQVIDEHTPDVRENDNRSCSEDSNTDFNKLKQDQKDNQELSVGGTFTMMTSQNSREQDLLDKAQPQLKVNAEQFKFHDSSPTSQRQVLSSPFFLETEIDPSLDNEPAFEVIRKNKNNTEENHSPGISLSTDDKAVCTETTKDQPVNQKPIITCPTSMETSKQLECQLDNEQSSGIINSEQEKECDNLLDSPPTEESSTQLPLENEISLENKGTEQSQYFEFEEVKISDPPTVTSRQEAFEILISECDSQIEKISQIKAENINTFQNTYNYIGNNKESNKSNNIFNKDIKLKKKQIQQRFDELKNKITLTELNKILKEEWDYLKKLDIYRCWTLGLPSPDNPIPHWPGRVCLVPEESGTRIQSQLIPKLSCLTQLLHLGSLSYLIWRPINSNSRSSSKSEKLENYQTLQTIYKNVLFGNPESEVFKKGFEVKTSFLDNLQLIQNADQILLYFWYSMPLVYMMHSPIDTSGKSSNYASILQNEWKACSLKEINDDKSLGSFRTLIKNANGSIDSISQPYSSDEKSYNGLTKKAFEDSSGVIESIKLYQKSQKYLSDLPIIYLWQK